MSRNPIQPIIIKGAGDIGSAIAHRLKIAGMEPILLEAPKPLVIRRRMAFAAALHEGEAVLEGVRGVPCHDRAALLDCLGRENCLPLVVSPGLLAELPGPRVVVDARMRKKERPPPQLSEAPLVIAIGPGFTAGVEAHLVVESNWGDSLGRVIREGASEAYTGKHRLVEGFGEERYLYAPHGGLFHTGRDVLEQVGAGEALGRIGRTPLAAKIAGLLRGLAYDGTAVEKGAKLAEVAPGGRPEDCIGIAARPARIAEGVLSAIGRDPRSKKED